MGRRFAASLVVAVALVNLLRYVYGPELMEGSTWPYLVGRYQLDFIAGRARLSLSPGLMIDSPMLKCTDEQAP